MSEQSTAPKAKSPFSILKRPQRRTLVLIAEDEAKRLGVPKDRPWLVVHNNKEVFPPEIILCYITKTVADDGTAKKKLSSDVLLTKGTANLNYDSFIRCSNLYSAKWNKIRLIGTVSKKVMRAVDEALHESLGLECSRPEKLITPQPLKAHRKRK